ncbi:MAG: F0F1 ATP synthase subunit B [Candidatus Eisenbacteria bacterium]|nr:F0F1 ATP synthase subunit B [Candidatus Eisenbacteria bacterium]
MELDYGQIVAQIIGFLVVLWIMNRFAWKPFLKILDDRKARIQTDLADAEGKRAGAEKLEQQYQEKLREIDAEARARIQAAVKNAEKIAAEIKDEARQDVKGILDRARDEIERDKAEALVALRNDVVSMALRASEKVLKENLDETRHRKAIADFVKNMESIDEQP